MMISTWIAGKLAPTSRLERIPGLAWLAPSSSRVPSTQDLDGFRHAQKLAYSCAEEIGRMLRPGWTEARAAKLMDDYLRDHGVRTYFHKSFAWYGARTRFQGFKRSTDFFSRDRRLEEEDVVILDTAPILDGYTADIGYTLSLLPNPALEEARALLLELRALIPVLFASPMSTKQIWTEIDRRIKAAGFDNAHELYPFSVLGHRLYRIGLRGLPPLLYPFSLHAYLAGGMRGVLPELLSPHHEGPKIGIWAIEPHIGGMGFGAKFEECLVVEENRAYWLDEDVPHARAPGRIRGSGEKGPAHG